MRIKFCQEEKINQSGGLQQVGYFKRQNIPHVCAPNRTKALFLRDHLNVLILVLRVKIEQQTQDN